MTWQKKSAAPDYVNLAEAVEALITGTPDGWILPWWNLVDQRVVDVNAFCALGPEQCSPLGPEDFLAGIGAGQFAPAVILVGLREKIACWARQRLFSAYCENVSPAGGCVVVWEGVSAQTHSRAWEEYDEVARFDLPTWATTIDIYETLLPNNAQTNAWPNNWTALRVRILDVGNNNVVQDSHPVQLPQFADHVTISIPTNHQQIVVDVNDNPPGNYGFRMECCGAPSSSTDYTTPDLDQPASAIARTPGVYTTIQDLGTELDAIEQKLHWILDLQSFMDSEVFIPLAASGEAAPVVDDEDVPLAPGDFGVLVTASSPTAAISMEFGDPPALIKMGRILMGDGVGWVQPVDLVVSPMIVLKPDATCTVVRVHTAPGVTATITKLVRAPAVPP